MGKPRIDELEQAVIDAIKADATLSGYLKTVAALSRSNLDFSTERFIGVPPMVLVFYAGGEHESRNVVANAYRHPARFTLYAAASNLRSDDAGRRGALGEKGCYDLLDDLRQLFAGTELTLPSNSGVKPYATLGAVAPAQIQDDMAVYSMEIHVMAHWDKI